MVGKTVVLALAAAAVCSAASVQGKVFDARSGEPLAKVKVLVTGTTAAGLTDAHGEFEIDNLPESEVELYITTIGYGLVKRRVHPGARVDIALHPEASARTDQVTVTSGRFETADTSAASGKTLTKSELQGLSMIILADPLRAAQAMPGVTSSNDFRAEFAVRGAAYEHVGVYVDGVLTDGFVHAANLGVGGGTSSEKVSLSILNAETVSEVSLYPGAYPSRFSGGSAAVLNLTTREGNYLKPAGRFSTGLLVTSAVVDAPFAKGKGSWLLAGRSSYVDYVQRAIERLTGTGRYAADAANRESTTLNFSDLTAKASYNFSPRHQVGISTMYGKFAFSDNLSPGTTNLERIGGVQSDNMMLTAYWRYTGGSHWWMQTRLFGLRNGLVNQNRNAALLDDRSANEVGGRSDISFMAGGHNVEAGVYVRSMRDNRLTNSFPAAQAAPSPIEDYAARTTQDEYYLQDTWKHERFSLTFGGRMLHASVPGQAVATPRAAFTWSPADSWTVRAGAGVYAQFPRLEQMFGFFGNPQLHAERSVHYTLGLERTVGRRTRVFAEVYHRRDRDQVFSLWEPRLVQGRTLIAPVPYGNLLRSRTRGVETGIQRRSANGLTGWVSYAYLISTSEDRADGVRFAGDFDQRHTITAFTSYRLRPTVDVGGQWRFGSGLPVPGFLTPGQGSTLVVSGARNTTRLPNYSRLDVRINKAFLFTRWKLTLSGEVLNAMGRKNVMAFATDPVRVFSSNRYVARLEDSFGIMPTVRVAFEF